MRRDRQKDGHDAELFLSRTLARRPRPLSWADSTLVKCPPQIPPQLYDPSDLSTQPDQRCLLISRRNTLGMFDRYASLYIMANWSLATEEWSVMSGRHLSDERYEVSFNNARLDVPRPQTSWTDEGPAVVEKTIGEGHPKVRQPHVGRRRLPIDRS